MLLDKLSLFSFLILHYSFVQAQYYALTGVQTGRQNGTRPLRRNIYDLQNDLPILHLYLQGLARMESASQTDQLSYQQVAGIHGRPYIPWNNFNTVFGAPQIGYCPHSSPLFATWHRPYLALIEQILASHVQAIVKEYPPSQQSTYQAAADNFRIPYWDWASHPDLPPIATVQAVQVILPSGPRTIRNPLYSHRFPPLSNSQYPRNQDSGLSTYPETVRRSVASINSRLGAEDLQRRTWTSIARSQNFNTFSTSSTPGTSIEAVHNSVHGDINGHMGSLSYSAFDPIFWLHHANVDRLTALYQCINPNTWLTTTPEPQGTYTIRQFDFVGGSTPLSPFTSSTGRTPYSSDSSRALSAFGYSYPEIIDWNQTPSQLEATCTTHLNRLYNPSGRFFKNRKHKRFSERTSLVPRSSSDNTTVSSTSLRIWTVSVKVSKFDYPSPFVIRAFIGEPQSDPQNWFQDKNIIGSVFVQQPVGEPSSFFKESGRDVVVYDEFDAEQGLWAHDLDGQDVDKTKDFLRDNLVWKVQTREGIVIPLEQIKSLKVSVAEEEVTLARSITELPTYTNRVLHPDITKGKLGGFQGTAAGKI